MLDSVYKFNKLDLMLSEEEADTLAWRLEEELNFEFEDNGLSIHLDFKSANEYALNAYTLVNPEDKLIPNESAQADIDQWIIENAVELID